MFLPGTPGERIGDLRTNRGLSQRELGNLIGITSSQMSRIESGKINSIGSEIIIRLANEFNVSTDYLLGLTTISTPKNYEISQLGLNKEAVRAMVTGNADMRVLNLLLGHPKFRELLRLINAYFSDIITIGVMARNEIMNMATSMLSDFAKANPEHKTEVIEDIREIRNAKIGEHETEVERIKNIFVSILKDINKDLDNNAVPGQAVNADIMRRVMAEILEQKPKTAGEVAGIVASLVKEATHIDDENTELYRNSIEQVITHIGKQE